MTLKKLLLIPSIALLLSSYNSIIVKGVNTKSGETNSSSKNLAQIASDPILSSCYGIPILDVLSPIKVYADELDKKEIVKVWFDVTIAGIVPINNITEMDYKLSSSSLDEIYSMYKYVADHIELFTGNNESPLTEDPVTNYLKERGIVCTDLDITFNGIRVDASLSDKYNYSDDHKMNTTEFLMGLSKSVYGVQESRTLLVRSKSIRNGSVITETTSDNYSPINFSPSRFITRELEENEEAAFNFYFNYGDINVYRTPNVAEMYFTNLVKDGVVSLSDFTDRDFVNYYNSIGKTTSKPAWHNANGVVDISGDVNPNILGKRFSVSSFGGTLSISPNDYTYFTNENLNTIDALVYIERVLKFNEKNLTKLESDIITYKYGVDYINRVPNEYQDTVKFLIAKGMINFEDSSELNDLFRPLTYKQMKTYLYRLNNKDARFDFSKVQLTDSDNYLFSKGFGETSLKILEGSSPYFDTSIVNEVASGVSSKKYDLVLVDTIGDTPSVNTKKFTVKRVFDTSDYKFFYKGIELNKDTPVKDSIKSVNSNGNKLTISFEIEALSEVSAVAILDANMVTESKRNNIVSVGTVDAIAYVSSNKSKEENIFISKTSLVNLPSMPLLVVNDKYIVNKQTGAKALLLNDNKKALIGNHVINFNDTIVYGLNGEIYYNLAVLKSIMSESMLSSLDPSEMFITTGYSSNERIVDLVNGSDSVVDSMYVRELRSKDPGTTDGSINETPKLFLNISQSNALSNYVIYDLKTDLGVSDDIKMVLEFNYVLPDAKDLGVDEEFIDDFINGGLTVSEVYDFAYKRPQNEVLRRWWDSNITFSNALMNYIMGTSKVEYVNSGYLMPKITILGDLSKTNSAGETYLVKLNQFFTNSIGLTSDFINSTLMNTNNSLNFINSYFNYQGNFHVSTGDSTLDSLIYKRNFNYLVGTSGKYYDGNSNSYKDSNYSDFGDYIVLGVNDNVYIRPEAVTYLEDYNGSSSKVLRLKNVPGVLYQPVESIQENSIYTISGLIGNSSMSFKGVRYTETCNFVAMMEPYKMYSDGSDLYKEKEHKTNLKSTLQGLAKSYFGDTYSKGVVIDSDDRYKSMNVGIELKKGYYLIDGGYYNIKKDGDTPNENNKVNISKTKGKEVYIFPTFGLSRVLFRGDIITKEITKANNDPRLNIRNVSNIGIVSNMIDSIVYKNSDYVNINGIVDGSKVVIGSNVFIKQKGLLQSEVVSGSNVISLAGAQISGLSLPDNFRSIAETHIGNIPMISSATGGVTSQFKDYITSLSFGTGQEGADTKGVLRVGDKGYLVVRNGIFVDKYREGSPFIGFCYSMRISDKVKFRKIGDSNRYILVNISTDSKDGNLSDTKYFTESLDLPDSLNSIVGLTPSQFKESSNLGDFVDELLKAYDIQRINDITGLVAYVLRMLSILLTATNLIITVLRGPTLDAIVYDIKYKKPKGYSGFSSRGKDYEVDLYSIFTFGLQSVDTEKSLLRGVIVSGCLAGVSVFLTLMYFKGF